MDCEKFESVLIDELYGELDELTSAAARRHAAGCARCAARLEGLRATRRLAALPRLEPPSTLEASVLAVASRVREQGRSDAASAGSRWARRAAGAVSIAGRWAMRPQTAMAALFLVMTGTSVLLLRGRSSRAPASAHVTVTEEGSPAPTAAYTASARGSLADEPAPLTGQALTGPGRGGDPKPLPAPAPAARVANNDATDPTPAKATLARRAPAPRAAAGARRAADDEFSAAPPAEVADPPAVEGTAAGDGLTAGSRPSEPSQAESTAPAARAAPPAAVAGANAASPAPRDAALGHSEPFRSALRAYQAGRFDDARRAFDALSAADPEADLWAARAVRDGRGCASAVARFDQIARRVAGTPTAWDAMLEGGRCYRQLGNAPAARAHLEPLLAVDAYRDRARAELDRLGAAPGRGPAR